MLTTSFKSIFSIESLNEALNSIKSKSAGIDKEFLDDFKQNATQNLQELHSLLINAQYTPQPIKKIKIPKNDKEYRPIAISAISDKIVQKALVNAIEEYFDSLMSNKSYAYRKEKSPLKAIGRCRDYINRGYIWVYKTDIDNFFEEIDHNILLNLLDSHIKDKKIVRLISLYLKNGGFSNSNYIEHIEGVHQGDILSPLLSNIYLTQMDNFLERENIKFVRYADDFTLFFKEQKELELSINKLIEFLKSIHLKSKESKSYSVNVTTQGFTFLGAYFKNKEIKIDNERLNKKISKLFEIARDAKNPKKYVKQVNEFIDGLKLYYLKIIKIDSTQFSVLFNAIIDASAQFVYLQRKAEKITTKKRV